MQPLVRIPARPVLHTARTQTMHERLHGPRDVPAEVPAVHRADAAERRVEQVRARGVEPELAHARADPVRVRPLVADEQRGHPARRLGEERDVRRGGRGRAERACGVHARGGVRGEGEGRDDAYGSARERRARN